MTEPQSPPWELLIRQYFSVWCAVSDEDVVLARLLEFGPDALAGLILGVEKNDDYRWPHLVRKSKKALLAMGRSRNLLVLSLLEKELLSGLSATALEALDYLDDRAAIPVLLLAIRQGVRPNECGRLIARLAQADDVPQLCSALILLVPSPSSSNSRERAARFAARWEVMAALARFRDPRAVRALLICQAPRDAVQELLRKIGPAGIPELIAALDMPGAIDVESAIRILVEFGEPTLAPLGTAFAGAPPERKCLYAVPLMQLGERGDELISNLNVGLTYAPLAELAALALLRNAVEFPTLALRRTLPELRRLVFRRNTPAAIQIACRAAYQAIETNTAGLRDLPLPSAGEELVASLPRTAKEGDLDPETLPIVP